METITLPPGAQPHTISFSPDGSYAYISDLGDGNLIVVRADDRQIVATLDLGVFFTHDTKDRRLLRSEGVRHVPRRLPRPGAAPSVFGARVQLA